MAFVKAKESDLRHVRQCGGISGPQWLKDPNLARERHSCMNSILTICPFPESLVARGHKD